MLHTFKNTDNGKKPYVSNVNQNHWIPIAHISKNLWEFHTSRQYVLFYQEIYMHKQSHYHWLYAYS